MQELNEKNKKKRMLITGILSAILYGLWAYYVNYGLPTVLASSIAQAVASFFGGYLVAGVIEFTFGITSKPWRFPISAFVPYGITLALYALIHFFVGTPDILSTIMPNIIIGTPYFVLYVMKLEKNDAQFHALAKVNTSDQEVKDAA